MLFQLRTFLTGYVPLFACSLLAVGLCKQAPAATFIIPTASDLFDPTFRGQGNTTWFGWGAGSFDQTLDNELIDAPPTTIGGATGAALNQLGTADILAGSGNVYTALNSETIRITTPTVGTPGTGFTTIIIQGQTAFGGFGLDPVFQAVEGILPSYIRATNALGKAQFWAKYELPGNAASYDVDMQILPNSHISLAGLEIDTFWSATAYGADIAAVPEPASAALLTAGALGLFAIRRRRLRARG